jgi:uncharacterized protein
MHANGRKMDRVEKLRHIIDDIVRNNPDMEESRCGFVHLYGVSSTCAILALKRGFDVELSLVAGMLHDIWNYKVGDSPEHGQLGAGEARKILEALGSFSAEEIDLVCTAISRHSDKESLHGEMDELLKDADVFQHYLYNPKAYEQTALLQASGNPGEKPMRLKRLERVMAELGLS